MPDDEPRACSFCDQYATHTCPRCGKGYCDAHGRDLCRDCLSPAGALPSAALVRGSVAALVIGAVVGIWLLVAPPTLPGEHRLAKSAAQNPASIQPQPQARQAATGQSVVPTPLPTTPSSPTPPAARSYTVVFGDTLSGIAESFGTTVAAIQAANPGVTPANLKAGQDLLIPPPGGFPTPLPTPSSTATATPTPSPTATATPAVLGPTPGGTVTPSPSPAATPAETPSPTATP